MFRDKYKLSRLLRENLLYINSMMHIFYTSISTKKKKKIEVKETERNEGHRIS